jgi:propanol-preferring alcohol dehydrogenase
LIPCPPCLSDAELAPLLCAGIIGYRALKRADLPPGGRLGLYGSGGSAHLAAQVALAQGASVSVMTRGEQAQELARSLGASFVGGASDMPPEPLDAAILFAPVGDLVLPAMAALDRGGALAIAGIYLTDIPAMSYDKYLFKERQLRSVTSNTRQDAREFLAFGGSHKLSVTTHDYPLNAADHALADLKAGRFDGAAVLIPLSSLETDVGAFAVLVLPLSAPLRWSWATPVSRADLTPDMPQDAELAGQNWLVVYRRWAGCGFHGFRSGS